MKVQLTAWSLCFSFLQLKLNSQVRTLTHVRNTSARTQYLTYACGEFSRDINTVMHTDSISVVLSFRDVVRLLCVVFEETLYLIFQHCYCLLLDLKAEVLAAITHIGISSELALLLLYR